MYLVHVIEILVPAAIHCEQLPLMIILVLNDPEIISFLSIINTPYLDALPLGHWVRQEGVLRIQQVVSTGKASIREDVIDGLQLAFEVNHPL